MTTFNVLFATAAVFLALHIIGNQAKPRHSPESVQVVHTEGLHIDRTLRQLDCSRPPTCISSFPAGPGYPGMLNFTAINAYFDEICTVECIEANIKYDHTCRNQSNELSDILESYYKQFLCGKNGDDYCYVLSLHNNNVTTLLNSCIPSNGTVNEKMLSLQLNRYVIDCSTASSMCLKDLADFSSIMGCCTRSYFDTDTVSSCSDVIDIRTCPSVFLSSANAVVGVFPMMLILLLAVPFLI